MAMQLLGQRKKKRSVPIIAEDSEASSLDYRKIRAEHEAQFPPDDVARMRQFVTESLRQNTYTPIMPEIMPYDIYHCPDTPPDGYPIDWNIRDVVENWNPDDTEPRNRQIYQGICVFDAATDMDKALAYREKEVPFILQNNPHLLQTSERWNQPNYLQNIFDATGGSKKEFRTEYSHNNHFMYWKLGKRIRPPRDWKQPTENIFMSYVEWLKKAQQSSPELDTNQDHWYFRINAQNSENPFLYDELPVFLPEPNNFFMVDPNEERGINCRFGMRGVIAETHFDSSRNFVVLLGGERRYILGHPKECPNFCLYPHGHPSARHSAVDWSEPATYAEHPLFEHARVNEVVLQAGDALYLPTFWFHYIISQNLNYQCNARSGFTNNYQNDIRTCGF